MSNCSYYQFCISFYFYLFKWLLQVLICGLCLCVQVEIVCMRVSDVSKEPGVDLRGIHFVKCLFVLFDIDILPLKERKLFWFQKLSTHSTDIWRGLYDWTWTLYALNGKSCHLMELAGAPFQACRYTSPAIPNSQLTSAGTSGIHSTSLGQSRNYINRLMFNTETGNSVMGLTLPTRWVKISFKFLKLRYCYCLVLY